MPEFVTRPGSSNLTHEARAARVHGGAGPGKRTLTEQTFGNAPTPPQSSAQADPGKGAARSSDAAASPASSQASAEPTGEPAAPTVASSP